MLAVEVVVMQPWVELGLSFQRVLVGACVGPLAQGGLDEAFGFAVGAWGVRPGEAVLDSLLQQRVSEAVVAVAWPVVGEHTLDREAEARVKSPCHAEEEQGRLVVLVGQDGGEADAAVVIDGDV